MLGSIAYMIALQEAAKAQNDRMRHLELAEQCPPFIGPNPSLSIVCAYCRTTRLNRHAHCASCGAQEVL